MSTIQEIIIQKFGSVAPPGMQPATNPFVTVMEIDTFQDFVLANVYVGIFYFFTYIVIGGLLIYLNPIPKSPKRMESIQKQFKMGLIALFCVLLYTTIWMWKFEKKMPYYGYWEGKENEFGLVEAIKQIFIYLFVFDTWFYLTHHFLHIDWLMKHVHSWHHAYMEPSAYAQDAVHPFEAILQGPMGHFMCTIVYPMNPLLISIIGYMTSIYALCAHDGRSLDVNDHTMHHYYRNCNFGLYWGFWDFVFGTRYNKTKYPKRYIPSWQIEAEKASKKEQ